MTRADVLAVYAVDAEGFIVSPGKFEGEKLYVPALWDACLNGDADESDDGAFELSITDDDRREFPELGTATGAILFEDENGFVYCTTASEGRTS